MSIKRYIAKESIVKIIIVVFIISGIFIAWYIKNTEKSNLVIPSNEQDISNEYEDNIINSDKENEQEEQNIEKPTPPADNSEITTPNADKKDEDGSKGKKDNPPVEETKQEEKQIIDKNDSNFELIAKSLELETLKSYKIPIMIDFGSDGCMPCREMAPVLVELNRELRGKAIIKYIDVWENPEESEGFDFSLIPTQFFFDKDGNVYKSHTGGLTKDEAMAILKELGIE